MNLSSPPVWQQYVQDFSLSKQYKLIFVPYGSWGLITNLEDSKKSLAIMYNHLDTGGKFILEIETVSSVPEPCGIWRRGVHSRLDGSKIAVNTLASFDIRTQIFKSLCRYELIIDSVITEVENEDFQMYLYRFDERDALLQEVGFKIINKYQDYTLTPATNKETPIIIYECSR
ncbi:hypothetical protein FJ364_02900 [Candidatus Dependentiae bacterium]|nr:hypothetical protein [Candidatus Dependentiae bacterium]